MRNLQQKSRELYANLVKTSTNMAQRVGRSVDHGDKEPHIWNDIRAKLEFTPDSSVRILDVGCGYGLMTQNWISEAETHGYSLVLMDFPEVADAIRANLLNDASHKAVTCYGGIFPDDLPPTLRDHEGFDYVLLYSVVHYTDDPLKMIEAAIARLRPGGKLLVGDIPNVNRKGRFLASRRGREFEAAYKGVAINDIPVYSSHHEFVAQYTDSTAALNDDLLMTVMTRYRSLGFDVFVLPQPAELPFSFTREDLLIVRHD